MTSSVPIDMPAVDVPIQLPKMGRTAPSTGVIGDPVHSVMQQSHMLLQFIEETKSRTSFQEDVTSTIMLESVLRVIQRPYFWKLAVCRTAGNRSTPMQGASQHTYVPCLDLLSRLVDSHALVVSSPLPVLVPLVLAQGTSSIQPLLEKEDAAVLYPTSSTTPTASRPPPPAAPASSGASPRAPQRVRREDGDGLGEDEDQFLDAQPFTLPPVGPGQSPTLRILPTMFLWETTARPVSPSTDGTGTSSPTFGDNSSEGSEESPAASSLSPYSRSLVSASAESTAVCRRPPLIIKWLYPPARFVEVTGTFCNPPWHQRIPLFWCPKSGCHWLDLLESKPYISGSHQYKLIVDGEWRCDPFAPICDDGSRAHNLNNFLSILKEPIRQHVFSLNQRRLSAFSQRSFRSAVSSNSLRSISQQWNATSQSVPFIEGCRSHTASTAGHPPRTLSSNRETSDCSLRRAKSTNWGSYSRRSRGRTVSSYMNQNKSIHKMGTQPTTSSSFTDLPSLRDLRYTMGVPSRGHPLMSFVAPSLATVSWDSHKHPPPQEIQFKHQPPNEKSSNVENALIAAQTVMDDLGDLPHPGNHNANGDSPSFAPSDRQSTGIVPAANSEGGEKQQQLSCSLNHPTRAATTAASVAAGLISENVPKVPQKRGRAVDAGFEKTPHMKSRIRTGNIQSIAHNYSEERTRSRRKKGTAAMKADEARKQLHSRTIPETSEDGGEQVLCQNKPRWAGRITPTRQSIDCPIFMKRKSSGEISPQFMRRAVSLMRLRQQWPEKVLELLHSPDILLELNIPDNVIKSKERLELSIGACMNPHPDKRKTGGADALFWTLAQSGALGIADGVGQWDRFGLDPRQFAEELMMGCKLGVETTVLPADPQERARAILQAGFDYTKSFGSSTAIIAALDSPGKTLGIANLGDSSIIVLRRSRYPHFDVVYRGVEQQHQWNCPYQLSRIPSESDYPYLIATGQDRLVKLLKNLSMLQEDSPDMCVTASVDMQEGDLIILGSDGLFDNLFDSEIISLCELGLSPFEADALHDWGLHTPAQVMATAIADAADFKSNDITCQTPFSVNARKNGAMCIGGKLDDITIVVAWVCRASSSMKDIYGPVTI